MGLKNSVNKFVLGELLADDLPAVAVQALVDGWNSPSLCQLAASEGDDTARLRALFAKALDELGIPAPTLPEAGLSLATSTAEEILDGSISPYEGAKRIWVKVYSRFPELKQLTVFVGLASEYEDDDKHRDDYARQIVEECKALLGR